PGSKDRLETERFIYYDGLVPSPDYLRCEKIDPDVITLRNRAKFDIARFFVVDRRDKDTVGFVSLKEGKLPFKGGAVENMAFTPVAAKDWPEAGTKEVRQALLDAGLFEPEADSLLKIWRK